jgi:4'-phosphopantetheinyl transferase
MQKIQNRILYPVILSVPEKVKEYKPKDRVSFLSHQARRALRRSAQKSGIRLGELLQDQNGAPLPFEGTYWSVTHKTDYVGGVVSPTPIGLDIEEIRLCSKGLFRKTASAREWSLAESESASAATFFRYWTSKEAVLKAAGIGIKDLSQCRVARILDDRNLLVRYAQKTWHIEHVFFDGHIASIVRLRCRIDWTIGDAMSPLAVEP